MQSILSLEQLAKARQEYLNAVINYNRFQLELMPAIGTPLGQDAGLAATATVVN